MPGGKASTVAKPRGETGVTGTDDAWKALAMVTDLIKHVETKTSVTLAATGVTAGILFNLVKEGDVRTPLVLAPAIVCAVGAIASGVFCGMALWPRLTKGGKPTGTLFFGHIAQSYEGGPGEFQHAARALLQDREKLLNELSSQIWASAHVARMKYRWNRLALVSLLLSIASLAGVAFSALL
ncbi:Pycsar system effector family protein [Micromonospora sp. NPDC047074]|uniref:Pycsar system effector family protein n=1 Tax=Micromonospora sp. NPDC047074 TaxID=3154339 RepID=UPI0033C6765E